MVTEKSIVQNILKDSWDGLPEIIQAHHRYEASIETGSLAISYPNFMQPLLTGLHFLGVLINKRAEHTKTTVTKYTKSGRQYWQREVLFDTGKKVCFNSRWEQSEASIIEYVNNFLGLKMSVTVAGEKLLFEGSAYILNFGLFTVSLPEWLLLGHTTIWEEKVSDKAYRMDFHLQHPWFGEVFRYSGEFTIAGAAFNE